MAFSPFKTPESIAGLCEQYPAAIDIQRASNASIDARLALARLWLSEGIPFAFKQAPAVYEAVRIWLSAQLAVDPKEITIIGSGRIGHCLSPEAFGRPFSDQSDLDLLVVAPGFFERLRAEFCSWSRDYENGKIGARNPTEKKYWDDNLSRGPSLINKGFLDAQMIPVMTNYPLAKATQQTMFLLQAKLAVTKAAPTIKKASLRSYKDWASFIRQVELSLVKIPRPQPPKALVKND